MAKILVLHGPNLNLLGTREPEIYGTSTLAEVDESLSREGGRLSLTVVCQQSNAEHELVEWIHAAARDGTAFIIINPGAFTHTSIALRDALLGVGLPFIEVHISNVFSREAFRQRSFLSDAAVGVISGLGVQGYLFALQAAHARLDQT